MHGRMDRVLFVVLQPKIISYEKKSHRVECLLYKHVLNLRQLMSPKNQSSKFRFKIYLDENVPLQSDNILQMFF